MKLAKLLENISYDIKNPNLEREITSVENNSLKVQNGALFLAIKGTKTNGADFIPQAVENGAGISAWWSRKRKKNEPWFLWDQRRRSEEIYWAFMSVEIVKDRYYGV